jgi:shikimate dehydrogenase
MGDIFDFDKPAKYAVMGNPIKHSKSPQIHTAFALQTGQKIEYIAIQVDFGGFDQAVSHFQAYGGKGLNVTVPFKLEAYQRSDSLTERAQRAGAVNTLVFQDDGNVLGDNTDGVGLVSDITEYLHWPINGQRVLILGAGGAARGVLAPLLEQQPASLAIANRTVSTAQALADDFADMGHVTPGGYDSLPGQQFELVINATAASLQGEVPPLPDDLLSPGAHCYDMMYASQPTAFMQWASQRHAPHIADGLGMLVGQAAESFFVWRGVKPEVVSVIKAVRESMI